MQLRIHFIFEISQTFVALVEVLRLFKLVIDFGDEAEALQFRFGGAVVGEIGPTAGGTAYEQVAVAGSEKRLFYVLKHGCVCRDMPADFPPWPRCIVPL